MILLLLLGGVLTPCFLIWIVAAVMIGANPCLVLVKGLRCPYLVVMKWNCKSFDAGTTARWIIEGIWRRQSQNRGIDSITLQHFNNLTLITQHWLVLGCLALVLHKALCISLMPTNIGCTLRCCWRKYSVLFIHSKPPKHFNVSSAFVTAMKLVCLVAIHVLASHSNHSSKHVYRTSMLAISVSIHYLLHLSTAYWSSRMPFNPLLHLTHCWTTAVAQNKSLTVMHHWQVVEMKDHSKAQLERAWWHR